MARTLWLYNLYRALCTAHLHRPFYVFVFLERGLSMGQIVMLHMIFSAAVIALEVPTGAWADRLGRRPSMGLGALLMALASVGYFLAPGFGAIAVCEFLFAAGLTLTSGADSAYLYDQLQSVGRADEYLRREATASGAKYIGLGVAAAAGGLLVHFVEARVTFLVTAAASFGAFLLTLAFPATRGPVASGAAGPAGVGPRAGPRAAPMARRMGEAVRVIRQNRALWWVILYSSLIFVLIRVSDTLFQPVLRHQGFDKVGVGLAFAGLSFVAAAAALRLGRVSWKRWETPLLWALPLLLAACYLFVSMFGPFVAVALMVPHFVVSGLYSPVVKTLLNEQLDHSHVRATVLSAESAVKRLVVLAVTGVLGVIFELSRDAQRPDAASPAGMRAALLACGVIALLALLTQALYQRHRQRRRTARPAPRSEPQGGVVSPTSHPAA